MRLRVIMAVGGLVGLVVWLGLPMRSEPRFRGKSAEYWFSQWVKVSGFWARPPEVFREMGEAAVPLLVAALQTEETHLNRLHQQFYAALPDRLQHWLSRPIPAEVVRWKAARALQEIGPAAAGALPALCATLRDPDPRCRSAVLNAIVAVGPAARTATPQLIEALEVPDRWFRCYLAEAIIQFDVYPAEVAPRLAEPFLDMLKAPHSTAYPYSAAALEKIRPVTREVLVELVEALRTQDAYLQRQTKVNLQTAAEMRSNTFGVLLALARATNSSVPWLMEKLDDSRSSVRALTANALGALETLADNAAPKLQELLDDPDPRAQAAATQALEKIRSASRGAEAEVQEGPARPDR